MMNYKKDVRAPFPSHNHIFNPPSCYSLLHSDILSVMRWFPLVAPLSISFISRRTKFFIRVYYHLAANINYNRRVLAIHNCKCVGQPPITQLDKYTKACCDQQVIFSDMYCPGADDQVCSVSDARSSLLMQLQTI
jgi:hypothetical protein